ncbi:MAG: DsbA family protein [Pseudoclavibacter sp.]|nr:DsbA family protein [Pseudoclavibacter sp.]
MTDRTAVDFWFDPVCPWAWMTSRWIVEVARQRDIEVHWHIMSLAILNEGDEGRDEAHRRAHEAGFRLGLVVAAVDAELGNGKTAELYEALGRRIHLERRGPGDPDLLAEACAEVGVPTELVERGLAGEYEQAYRASHAEGIGRVGQDVGTPIIAVNGVAFFGPVISPAPKGEQALRLFDGVVMAAEYDGFFELKRSRTRGPRFE